MRMILWMSMINNQIYAIFAIFKALVSIYLVTLLCMQSRSLYKFFMTIATFHGNDRG